MADKAKTVNFFMTYDEWKMMVSLMHTDKYQGLSEVQAKNMNKAFALLQKMKAGVDPLAPINLLRAQKWDDIAPAYKKRANKS